VRARSNRRGASSAFLPSRCLGGRQAGARRSPRGRRAYTARVPSSLVIHSLSNSWLSTGPGSHPDQSGATGADEGLRDIQAHSPTS
jgi:hypothetical protein